jgi:ABC-type uncharacterized transport system auxiliary subunit
MYSRIFAMLALIALCSLPVGCGGEAAQETTFDIGVDKVTESLRSSLEGMQKSGQKTSQLSALETDINGIKSSNKEKAEALLKLYIELDAAQGPEKVKEICTKMLKLL